jgi:hypothetical protein
VPSRQSTSRLSDASCATSSPRLRSSAAGTLCRTTAHRADDQQRARSSQRERQPAEPALHIELLLHTRCKPPSSTKEATSAVSVASNSGLSSVVLLATACHRCRLSAFAVPDLSSCARVAWRRLPFVARAALQNTVFYQHVRLPSQRGALLGTCGAAGVGRGGEGSGGAPLGAGEQQDLQRILFFVLP